jgi:hypothetical protein
MRRVARMDVERVEDAREVELRERERNGADRAKRSQRQARLRCAVI